MMNRSEKNGRYAWCTVPTMITLLRIVLIPFIFYALCAGLYPMALALFAAAGISDIFDGILARYLRQESKFGALLDPFADKLLIGSLLIFFTFFARRLPVWFFIFYVIKELALMLGALYLWVKKSVGIRADWSGKVAMAVQTIFIAWLIYAMIVPQQAPCMGYWLMASTLLFSLVALFSYAIQAGIFFKNGNGSLVILFIVSIFLIGAAPAAKKERSGALKNEIGQLQAHIVELNNETIANCALSNKLLMPKIHELVEDEKFFAQAERAQLQTCRDALQKQEEIAQDAAQKSARMLKDLERNTWCVTVK